MNHRTTLNCYINKQLEKDKKFAEHYARELLINEIAKLVATLRNSANLTQAELATKSGTTQPVIARLESGTDSRIPSLDLLARIATASHAKLYIKFEHINK
jgi:predicted transcriptional regulator